MENKHTDIFDVLMILAKHRSLIIWILAIVSVGSVAYALLAPQYWLSHAVVRPVDDEAALSSLGGSLMGISGALLGGGISFQGEDFITIMSSRTFSEDVVQHFNLIEYFEIDKPDSLITMELALKKLAKKVRALHFDEEEGTVHIRILTKDKKLSQEIANYYWEKLDEYNREYKVTKGRENREFLEKRLHEVQNEIERLSVAMREFMIDNKALELDEQSKEVVSVYSELIASKYQSDLELEFARRFMNEDGMEIQRLREKQKVLQGQIETMEGEGEGVLPQYIPALNEFPELQYEWGKLRLEFDVQRQLYEFLYPQYEQARIDELKDTPTIELIDHARMAGLRAKPKRARLCVTNFVIAFIFSIFLAFIVEYVQVNGEKAASLWRTLWRRKQ